VRNVLGLKSSLDLSSDLEVPKRTTKGRCELFHDEGKVVAREGGNWLC